MFATTAGPVWNNWSRNGTFPPIMLLVEDLLAAGKYTSSTNQVGVPIEISVPSNQYGPELTFVVPDESHVNDPQTPRTPIAHRMTARSESDQYFISLGNRGEAELSSDVETPGVYDVWLHGLNGQFEPRRFALNVDSSESEMKLVNRQNLLSSLEKSKPSWVMWDQFNPEPKQQAASSTSKLLLLLLLGLLVGEQILAYSSSYHTRSV